ncbi:MAG: hypothetical protein AAF846_19740 [Chloroflexota bacterium]
MSQNVDGMVRAGVDAYRAGNKAEARTLLERAIEIDSYNETAWLWLSAVVETKEEQQTCLENVLVINPDNSRARQGLKSLGVDPDTVLAETEEEYVEEDPYAVPSSSASVTGSLPETSSEEYDDWVGALNIGGSDTTTDSPDNTTTVSEDLFGDIDFSADDGAFTLDDNIFTEAVFAEDPYEDDEVYEDAYYDEGVGYDVTTTDSGYIDDNLFNDDGFDDGDDMFADYGTLENYNDAIGDNLQYDDSQFIGDPFAEVQAEPEKPSAPSELTNEELLQRIPSEIEATRAPGVDEKIPQYHYIILGVLAVVNLGALAFVGLQFVS